MRRRCPQRRGSPRGQRSRVAYLAVLVVTGAGGSGCQSLDFPPEWLLASGRVLATRSEVVDRHVENAALGEFLPEDHGLLSVDVADDQARLLSPHAAWIFTTPGTGRAPVAPPPCGVLPPVNSCSKLTDAPSVEFTVSDDVSALLDARSVLVLFAVSTSSQTSALSCLENWRNDRELENSTSCLFGSSGIAFGSIRELYDLASAEGHEVPVPDDVLDSAEPRPDLVPRIDAFEVSVGSQPATSAASGDVIVVPQGARMEVRARLESVEESLWRSDSSTGELVDARDSVLVGFYLSETVDEFATTDLGASWVLLEQAEMLRVFAVARDEIGNEALGWFDVRQEQ